MGKSYYPRIFLEDAEECKYVVKKENKMSKFINDKIETSDKSDYYDDEKTNKE